MFILLYTILLSAPPAPVEVQTLAGESIVGQLVELKQDSVTIASDEKRREIPRAELSKVIFKSKSEPASAPKAWVELIDGSMLPATSFLVQGDSAEAVLVGDQTVKLPVRLVRSVRLKQQNTEQAKEWNKIRAARTRSDLIAIRKNERIDYISGVLRDVSAEAVQFELDGDLIPVKIQKVEGLVYHQAATTDLAPEIFRFTDDHGMLLAGASLTAEADRVRITTAAGVEIERSYDTLRQLDFSADKIVYLSDLNPHSVEWTPFFEAPQLSESLQAFYRPKMDRALTRGNSPDNNGKLQLMMDNEGTIANFDKGIAMHSRSSIRFDLPADARRFRALVGIDARVRQHGHVRFVVRGDGQQLHSVEVGGTQLPRELSVDIVGVQQLELFVDFGDNLDVGDHLNLCNARLIK
jgi:hypothetical protein